jgi:hypothetical protein
MSYGQWPLQGKKRRSTNQINLPKNKFSKAEKMEG